MNDATKDSVTGALAYLAASKSAILSGEPWTPTMQEMYLAATNTIDTLRDQLAEAQKDSERLDWMIEQCAYVVSDPDCCDGYWLNYQRNDGTLWTQATEHETPRAAIDAAKGEQ